MKTNSNFNQMCNTYTMMQKFVISFIGITLTLIICWFIFLGVVFFKVGSQIGEIGFAGVIQHLWCGEQATCKLPP